MNSNNLVLIGGLGIMTYILSSKIGAIKTQKGGSGGSGGSGSTIFKITPNSTSNIPKALNLNINAPKGLLSTARNYTPNFSSAASKAKDTFSSAASKAKDTFSSAASKAKDTLSSAASKAKPPIIPSSSNYLSQNVGNALQLIPNVVFQGGQIAANSLFYHQKNFTPDTIGQATSTIEKANYTDVGKKIIGGVSDAGKYLAKNVINNVKSAVSYLSPSSFSPFSILGGLF